MGTTPSQTNASGQSIARMAGFNNLGTPEWKSLLPTEITDIMAVTETAMHDTIDPSNQYEAGALVGLTCAPKYRGGAVAGLLDELLEGAVRCAWTGPLSLRSAATRPTSATSVHYVVPTLALAIPVNTLIMVSGSTIAANNGLKVVSGSPTTTTIPVVGGLVIETFTAAQNVTIEVCGFQFTAGDLTMTTASGITTIGATAKNLTQLLLVSGQSIFVGDASNVLYAFGTAANYGPARITSTPIAGSFTIEATFGQAFVTDAGAGKTMRLFFGKAMRAVARTDASFIEPFYQIETKLEHVGAADAASYVYDENCAIDTFTISMPSKALATMAVDFLATDATIVDTQRLNAATPAAAKRTVPFNTTSDINGRVYLTSDGTPLTGYITSCNLVVENQANENPALGVLGSAFTSRGKIKVRAEINAFLVASGPVTAARGNSEVKANVWMRNTEGAYVFDIPSARVANGQASFPKNQVVTIDLPTTANKDTQWGTSLIVSCIPGCPPLPARA